MLHFYFYYVRNFAARIYYYIYPTRLNTPNKKVVKKARNARMYLDGAEQALSAISEATRRCDRSIGRESSVGWSYDSLLHPPQPETGYKYSITLSRGAARVYSRVVAYRILETPCAWKRACRKRYVCYSRGKRVTLRRSMPDNGTSARRR